MSDGQPEIAGATSVVVRRIATICNQRGLHARASARFVKMAAQFDADVRVRKNGTEVSGRSIMGLMMLAAAPGTIVELSASGPQAEAAVGALADLIECKFNED
ncbi:MAG TPA: HPr family phosphocarrier protein [Stellaceae bacterium]|jgi:phosphocarrier protein HPr|nr:HPr family phosphocarrier protein [Stellaceae bacterium]